jgi:U4/U6.U5 tri-snRNP component SNU23
MAGYRRTWDKEEYAQKAKDRLEREERGENSDGENNGGDGEDGLLSSSSSSSRKRLKSDREEFKPAEDGADGPMGSDRAFLQSRSHLVDTDSKVGKIEIVRPGAAAGDGNSGPTGPGYWCEVCKCLLKDSSSYLDHINGKRHQKNLGFSMRVERVGLDAVKARIAALKQKKLEDKIRNAKPQVSAIEDFNSKVNAAEEEETLRRAQKKAEHAAITAQKKAEKQQQKDIEKQREEDKEQLDAADEDSAAIAAMMGFSGFGSSKKK